MIGAMEHLTLEELRKYMKKVGKKKIKENKKARMIVLTLGL
jgi:hypothetical protein